MLWHVLIILGVISLAQCKKLDEMMTDDEIVQVFRTTRSNIPQYETVSLSHNLWDRLNRHLKMRFTAFGKAVNSYLNPADGQLAGVKTPVWLKYTHKNGTICYRRMPESIVGKVAGFYYDPFNSSSIVVHRYDKRSPSFEGHIGNLVIRSLPARLHKFARSEREIQQPNQSQTLIETDYHVIIKSDSFMSQEKVYKSANEATSEILHSLKKADELKANFSSQAIVFPSIMVTTDYTDSKTSANDFDYHEEIMYILAFWNAVDLRFRQVQYPKIRLRIAGIIIGQDRTATPYINNNLLSEGFNSEDALWDMRSFWYEMTKRPDFPKSAYHLVATMTDYKMVGTGDDKVGTGILGISHMQSLCRFRMFDYMQVFLVHDKRGFDGILTATHELGHMFGLDHDGSTGDACDEYHGFIMRKAATVTVRNQEWSPCSLKRLETLFMSGHMNCVNEPSRFYPPGERVARILPGVIKSDNEQCQDRGFTGACERSPAICKILQCYYGGFLGFIYGWWCKNALAAAEGTICGPEKNCINGTCQCITNDCVSRISED